MNFITFKTQKKDGGWKTWKNVVSPLKYGKMLDEQLDYATVSLLRVNKKTFAPMTKAQVVITSVMGDEVQTETLDYLIAGDSATESPVGSGIYNHELTLIEYTKFLEGFIVDNLCFTNQDIARVEGMAKLTPNINYGEQDRISQDDYEKFR